MWGYSLSCYRLFHLLHKYKVAAVLFEPCASVYRSDGMDDQYLWSLSHSYIKQSIGLHLI